MLYLLIAYFITSALIAAWQVVSWESDRNAVRFITAALMTAFNPLLLLLHPLHSLWEWLEKHAQARTWYYYVVDRKRLIAEPELLDAVHRHIQQERSSGSLRDRLYRMAFRTACKVNNYWPGNTQPRPGQPSA